ncbi:MAG: hypothetical protein CR982_09300 [Candidatus Cloacimonadota bacterium]|nr:MAG: hypothetical protein CR982_09300 [Candidatus Cloacimonadota bacterium]PIE77505.1 MAG: hypothetical protein CSA15_12590 [Candidatus Delongbacteria bacterium]
MENQNRFFDYTIDDKVYRFTRDPYPSDENLIPLNNSHIYINKFIKESFNETQKFISIEDDYGVLPTLLGSRSVSYSDSLYQEKALELNSVENNVEIESIDTLEGSIEAIPIVSCVKDLSYFKYILGCVSLFSDKVIIYGMDRNYTMLYTNIVKDFYQNIDFSRGWKRSRVTLASKPKIVDRVRENYYFSPVLEERLCNFPGSYAYNKPDLGSIAMMKYLKGQDIYGSTLDIGCGNGVLTFFVNKNFDIKESFLTDISKASIRSAKKNLEDFGNITILREFYSENIEKKFDNIFINPPFHHNRQTTRLTALNMFKDVKSKMDRNSKLFIVYNRHLNYTVNLKSQFSKVDIISKDPKFIVVRCSL